MGSIIVLILRLVVPLSIFRWPLWGGLAALLLDLHDQNLIEIFGVGSLPALDNLFIASYQQFDKVLDLYYLIFEFFVVIKWQDQLARITASFLFLWRFLGFILFGLTGAGVLLVIFPNIFENFFLLYLISQRFIPQFKFSSRNLVLVLLLAGLPKLFQEYWLHIWGDFRTYDQIKTRLFDLLKNLK